LSCKILLNKEVTHNIHIADDPQLLLDAFAHLLGYFSVAFFGALIGELSQILVHRIVLLGDGVVGQQQLGAELHIIDLFNNFVGVVDGRRQIAEELLHLPGRLQVKFGIQIVVIICKPETVGIVNISVGLQCQQDIVRLRIFLLHIMRIVGRDHLDVVLFGPFDQRFVTAVLISQPVPLPLDVVIIAKNIKVPFKQGPRFLFTLIDDGLVDLAGYTTGGRDKSLGMFGQYFLINTRFVVKAVGITQRAEL